jgi:cell division protein FtsB
VRALDTLNSAKPHSNAALYCLTILALALIAMTVVAGYELNNLFPLKAVVQQQEIQLKQRSDTIQSMTAELKRLAEQKQTLETDLLTAKEQAKAAEAAKTELENTQRAAQTSAALEDEDSLCAIIEQNIRLVADQLSRDDFFRLRDEREAEAEAVLESYEKQLATCIEQLTAHTESPTQS